MAAPFQNYSGGVLLADIVKNNLSTYVFEAIKERSPVHPVGAVVRNALSIHAMVLAFKFLSSTLCSTEEIMDGTATWEVSSGYLTPQKSNRNPDRNHLPYCLRRG